MTSFSNRSFRKAVWLTFWLLSCDALAAAPRVLVLGDSLSAAYGIPTQQGWVQLLQGRLEGAGYPHRVVNASISGETTRGGLTRLPQALELHRPQLVVVELGGNDGLRGFGPDLTRRHLREMIRLVRSVGAEVLLLGVQLPANYGKAYRTKFHRIYHDLAEEESAALVPFFLDGVAQEPSMMQVDGIHPNATAQRRILENVWPALEPLLSKRAGSDVVGAPGDT